MRLPPEVRPPADRRALHELAEGWRYVARSTPIRSLLLFLAGVGVLSAPYMVLMPVVAGRTLGGGAGTLGALMAASGVGALICAVRLVMRTTVVGLGRLMALATAGFGVACVLLGLSQWFWLSMALMVVTGYGLMYQVVATNTIVQTIVDDDKRGRVMAYYTIALLGSAPLGSLLSGALADRIGVRGHLRRRRRRLRARGAVVLASAAGDPRRRAAALRRAGHHHRGVRRAGGRRYRPTGPR